MRIVVFGLSISSSWGNGHATTWRALLRAMSARGHDILFLERDQPWYAAHRDMADPDFCRLVIYHALSDLQAQTAAIAQADAVIVGSYVPEGLEVCEFVLRTARGITAFYDIDTPVTLSALASGRDDFISAKLIPRFDLYLSFTAGPTLQLLETNWGARRARALYCSVDPDLYRPRDVPRRYDLGYLGTYSADRQPALERLLLEPARLAADRRFVVAGPQYPADIAWPPNVERIEHLPPGEHPEFYSSLRWTLNITRAAMKAAGFSPSVRIFEAAACGTPILSDAWPGLDAVLDVGTEVHVVDTPQDVLAALVRPDRERTHFAEAARARVLAEHTAAQRAIELEALLMDVRETNSRSMNARSVPA